MEPRKYHVFLERQGREGYVALVAELPGCLSEGRTEDDALKKVKDAIQLYMEDVEAGASSKKARLVQVTF
ncbi:MAG: type II toxin-antitoxin system HicB family antitoxin [Nitrososphaerota archaeon]|nr:type II toxin-antitoxin system HicB family antitoxin [Nitrososphaerota archaeon]MDG6909700.1 type II toxin-antitoxin system HicB family antitoxin [Nitrososphaerota archaeon]MDG6949906.1 type II toxin-antitoxin system HicB family antitoxin [Nitrososphaerota archaeon]MDG6961639.1 type II toxin-antitoxin system HicB family antitoxin [Nitrososphaerota archaeon]MDG6972822.1 type II toxin-antitoxin system HicB family antitoxin [Nitrososphaerota archaeon]